MPHLRFRAVERKDVAKLTETLGEKLQPLMDCPLEDFTFECVATEFFFAGQASEAYPFVDVLWFDRGQATQDEVAAIVTQEVRHVLEKPEQDVAVIFTSLSPKAYYDNGSHY